MTKNTDKVNILEEEAAFSCTTSTLREALEMLKDEEFMLTVEIGGDMNAEDE